MRRIVLVFGAALAVAGCNRSNDAPAGDSLAAALPPGHVPIAPSAPTDLAPRTQALLDSGNTAFRLKQFDQALAFYAKASEAQPEHAAPWFGTYMVGQATKDQALADSALRMVRQRSPNMEAHPGGTPGDMPMPAPGTPPHGSIPPAPHGAIPSSPRKS